VSVLFTIEAQHIYFRINFRSKFNNTVWNFYKVILEL
jgi:hypothetical protein